MALKDIVIIGNGGFAREVEWLIERINQREKTWNFLGFIDNNGANRYNKTIGNDEFIEDIQTELHVAVAIGNPQIRKHIVERYKKNKYLHYPNLIDPSALLSAKNKIGKGNIICAGSILTVGITIHNFNIINLNCTIGHDAILNDFITVNPNVNISGNVSIENGTMLGTGSKVIQGVNIGKRVALGAGAVVIRDMPNGCTAVGIPAKIIKYEDKEEIG